MIGLVRGNTLHQASACIAHDHARAAFADMRDASRMDAAVYFFLAASSSPSSSLTFFFLPAMT